MNTPVDNKEFSKALLGLVEPYSKMLIAVSGGGDSMALALLANEWAKQNNVEILAVTVDHKLREESSREALEVQKTLAQHGIKHEILVWQGEKPATHIQELAREARYRLLLDKCHQQGFKFMAVAHNLEDQIETFWMRLAHGSGLDGLAAMADVRELERVNIIRPLMSFNRERLRATCKKYQLNWIEDPSNQNKKYLRVKLREFEDLLATEGLTVQRLTKTMQKLEDSRRALQYFTDKALSQCVSFYPEGYAIVNIIEWKKLPLDIQRRIISQSLQKIAPKTYSAGFEALSSLCEDMQAKDFSGKTLFGCEIFPEKSGDVFISREENDILAPQVINSAGIWDGRFIYQGFDGESLKIGALGEKGLVELRKNKTAYKRLEQLPFKIKKVLPAVWREDRLLAVPHIEYYSQDCPKDVEKLNINFVNS